MFHSPNIFVNMAPYARVVWIRCIQTQYQKQELWEIYFPHIQVTYTYTSRVLRLILPYNPLQERILKGADTHQHQSLLPLWLSLSQQLPLQALLPRQDSFLLPSLLQLCGFLYTAKKKCYAMYNDIIIIVSLSYHCRRECQSSSKWRMTAEWSLTSLRMLLHHHWFLSSVDSQV